MSSFVVIVVVDLMGGDVAGTASVEFLRGRSGVDGGLFILAVACAVAFEDVVAAAAIDFPVWLLLASVRDDVVLDRLRPSVGVCRVFAGAKDTCSDAGWFSTAGLEDSLAFTGGDSPVAAAVISAILLNVAALVAGST